MMEFARAKYCQVSQFLLVGGLTFEHFACGCDFLARYNTSEQYIEKRVLRTNCIIWLAFLAAQIAFGNFDLVNSTKGSFFVLFALIC